MVTDRLEPVRLCWQLDGLVDPPGLPAGVVALMQLTGADPDVQTGWWRQASAFADRWLAGEWKHPGPLSTQRLLLGAAAVGSDGPAGRRWRRAWRRAEVVREMAARRFDPAEVWTAGFLHGVGYEALAYLRPKTVARLTESPQHADPMALETALEAALGIGPASAARRLIGRWRLGRSLVEAFGCRQNPLGRFVEAVAAERPQKPSPPIDPQRRARACKRALDKE
ncbi:MAG: HDOD domain-containing protein, partial [Phycisphaeraceae bacterium]|nr:HDOD domain-containing protein [Phycisphaeraceae bacterium]